MIAALTRLIGASPLLWRLLAALGLLIALAAVALWLRADAVADDRAKREAEAARTRTQTIEESLRRRNDVETLNDDDLLDRLLGRVPGREYAP